MSGGTLQPRIDITTPVRAFASIQSVLVEAVASVEQGKLVTWSKDATAIRDWAATAKAGDEMVYARERHLSRLNAGASVVRTLVERHLATAYHRPAPDAPGTGIREYVVRRIKPGKVSIGHDPAQKRQQLDGDMAAVLRVLKDCARNRDACPNNRELARRAKIGNGDQASYQLKKLVKRGFVAVAIVNEVTGARVVTILKDGIETAQPIRHFGGKL